MIEVREIHVAEIAEITESKIELTERLRREGRWSEASRWKDQTIKELRAGGMKRAEASEEGWRRMAAEFPPLVAATAAEPQAESPAESSIEPSSSTAARSIASSTSTNSSSTATTATIGDSIPDAWGTIPAKALLEVEFEWVHQNRFLVIQERPSGPVRLDWTRARSPAPSYGAIGLMQFAAANPKGFVDTLVKLRAAEEESQGAPDGSGVVKDMGLKEVERLLASITINETCPHCGKVIQKYPKNRAVSG
jgi:hypothetical protein